MYAIDVECCEDQVEDDCSSENGKRREEQLHIGANGKSDGRWGENEFNILGHAGKKAPLPAEGFVRIVECTSSFGDSAGHLCVAESEGQVHDDDEPRGDCHAEGATFLQAEIPAEVHPRYDITYAQAP